MHVRLATTASAVAFAFLLGCTSSPDSGEGLARSEAPEFEPYWDHTESDFVARSLSPIYDEVRSKGGISSLSSAQQNAYLVDVTPYLLGNGGFPFFFESDWDYDQVVEAHRAIGAGETADILEQALAVFPEAVVPDSWPEREPYLRDASGEEPWLFRRLLDQYYALNSATMDALAAFIRARGLGAPS